MLVCFKLNYIFQKCILSSLKKRKFQNPNLRSDMDENTIAIYNGKPPLVRMAFNISIVLEWVPLSVFQFAHENRNEKLTYRIPNG